jgi:acetyl-CoA acyltransferase 2
LGDSSVALCGGTENMSLAPYATRGTRFGTKLGVDLKLEDTLWSGLTDSYVQLPMALTAENLAEQYKITREQCDQFAMQTQKRWQSANENGRFKDEIVPIKLKGKKGDEFFQVDEHARGDKATMEDLGKLPPVFKKNGTVTAGNASGICDGAAAIVVANEDAIKSYGMQPLVRIVSYHVNGCDPKIMGIGPVNAIRNLLKKTKLTLDQIDIIEV